MNRKMTLFARARTRQAVSLTSLGDAARARSSPSKASNPSAPEAAAAPEEPFPTA